MITELTLYGIKCDRCGQEYVGFEQSYQSNSEYTEDDAAYDGWLITNDHHHFCPNCFTKNEETGELVPKKDYPFLFQQFRTHTFGLLPYVDFKEDENEQWMESYWNPDQSHLTFSTIQSLVDDYNLTVEVDQTQKKTGFLLIFKLKNNSNVGTE